MKSPIVSHSAGEIAARLRRNNGGSRALIVASVATIVASGCATTQSSEPVATDTRAIAYDEARGPATSASSTPRLSQSRATIQCDEAPAAAVVRCAQCPTEPTPVAVARSFYAAEASVQRCVRDAQAVRVRGEFVSAGVPVRFDVRGPGVGESDAQCLRAALCTMRVPTFRTPSAIVRFEYGSDR
jgi:hypothetical protein